MADERAKKQTSKGVSTDGLAQEVAKRLQNARFKDLKDDVGERCAADATNQERPGKFAPAFGSAEGFGRIGVGDGGDGLSNANAAVNREAQGEDDHQDDRFDQTHFVSEGGVAELAGEGEGTKEQVAMSHAYFQTPTLGRQPGTVCGQVVDQGFGEAGGVDGGGEVSNLRIACGFHKIFHDDIAISPKVFTGKSRSSD